MTMDSLFRAPFAALTIALLAGSAALAGCGPKTTTQPANAATSVNDTNVADKVQQAVTPEDHQNLAAYYDARAQAAEREAVADRELKGRYERHWRPVDHPMSPDAPGYYDRLIEDCGDDVREYRGLAEWHREMARNVQPAQAGE